MLALSSLGDAPASRGAGPNWLVPFVPGKQRNPMSRMNSSGQTTKMTRRGSTQNGSSIISGIISMVVMAVVVRILFELTMLAFKNNEYLKKIAERQ